MADLHMITMWQLRTLADFSLRVTWSLFFESLGPARTLFGIIFDVTWLQDVARPFNEHLRGLSSVCSVISIVTMHKADVFLELPITSHQKE